MRYTGPKNKIARREGVDLGLKTPQSQAYSSLMRKLNIIPGQHGKSRRRRTSDYGLQLREKQKMKRMYGITEKKFQRYYDKASLKKGNTAEILVESLELRIDNVIFRLGFAPTRASARQLVTHGHIVVNNKAISVPSYAVGDGDTISFKKEKTQKIPSVNALLSQKDFITPSWLVRKGILGKVMGIPSIQDYSEDINLQSVIEFYSR